MAPKTQTVDGYLKALSREQRAALDRLRKTIRAAVPEAEECLCYRVPAFRLDGRFLVGLGAATHHCSFFPGSAAIQAHRDELNGYDTSKGTIRFQPDRPLPAPLVRRLVKERIAALDRSRGVRAGQVATARGFAPGLVRALATSRILRIHAGWRPHRFIGIWVVVTRGRVFVRSWELRPKGWFHALCADPVGRIQVGNRRVRIRARQVRGEGILRAVDLAYAVKYSAPGSAKYVRGLRRGRRRASTTELLPADGQAGTRG